MSGNNEKMVLVRPGPQKKSEDHQSKYEFNSTWAERIASLIVVGLAVEIAAVFIFQKPFREGALTILANMLIVAGVWGELIFARRAKEASDQIVAAAHTRAAEAMEGAVFAIKEARQRAEPRQVDREKFNEWIAMGATAKAEVVYVRECPDCAWLAFSIAAMLKGANWDVSPLSPQPINPALGKEHLSSAQAAGGMWDGISVLGNKPSFRIGDADPYSTVYFALLQSVDRRVHGVTDKELPDGFIRIVVAARP